MTEHLLQVRYTKDAHNFTSWRDLDAGRVGAFGQELVARQLGQATFRVWETCDTSPFAADLLAAAIKAEGASDWADFPLPDGAYNDLTRDFTQQDIVNYIPLPAQQQGTRSRTLYRTAPGLDVIASIGDGPHRGAISVEGALFVVSGQALYEVKKDGTATSRGTIPGTGRVSMAYNQIVGGNQLVVGNGSSGYVWNTYTGTFTQITDAGFVGFKTCDFLGTYIVGVEPLGRYWYHSALADATSYNTLDRYEAETSPDGIVGLVASHNEVLVFGARTIEPWINDPVANAEATAFQLERGSVIERGCLNGNTIRRLDNSVFFIGDDRVPYRLNGYTPQPIGTPVLAAAWRDLDPTKVFAFTYEDRGHVIYYVTWGDGQTWGYDVVTQKWHRRESFGHDRWRLATLVKWGSEWIGGDFQNGKLYRLAWDFVYEGCEIMPRRIRTGVVHADGNPVTVNAFKVVASTGTALTTAGASIAPSISGNLPSGNKDDAVSYQYTISPAFPGQTVTLTVSGDFPPGLSMDASGHVTGTLTTGGTYVFTITPSSECADGEPLRQVVTVATVEWGANWAAVSSAIANGSYALTADATDWSAALLQSSPGDSAETYNKVVLGPDTVVLFKTATGKASVSGGAFAAITGLSAQTINQGIYTDGVYLLAANTSTIERSTTGTAFTTVLTPNVPGHSADNLLCLSARADLVVACGFWPHTSTDVGVTWASPTGTAIFTGGAQAAVSIANDGTKFIAGGALGSLASTTDGVAFTQIASPFAGTTAIRGCAWTNGIWVVGNSNGEFAYSTTGLPGSWTVSGDTLGGAVQRIVAANGLFVAVGGNGKIKTSTDGAAWTDRTNSFGGALINDVNVVPFLV